MFLVACIQGGDGGDLSSLMAALPAGMAPKTTFVEGDLVVIVKGEGNGEPPATQLVPGRVGARMGALRAWSQGGGAASRPSSQAQGQ